MHSFEELNCSLNSKKVNLALLVCFSEKSIYDKSKHRARKCHQFTNFLSLQSSQIITSTVDSLRCLSPIKLYSVWYDTLQIQFNENRFSFCLYLHMKSCVSLDVCLSLFRSWYHKHMHKNIWTYLRVIFIKHYIYLIAMNI